MVSFSLNGKWNLKSTDSYFECQADVPGSDFGNLIKNDIIKSPLISGREEDAMPVAKRDFVFERSFDLSENAFEYENIILNCSKLDTLCKCYINEEFVFESNNAHISVKNDISKFVKSGKNTIRLVFSSAVNYITSRQKENPLPKNNNGIDGISYIRKPACHFGWDWGPCVPYNYVGDISVDCYNSLIENITINQEIVSNKATIKISADNTHSYQLFSPDGEEIKGKDGVFEIDNPRLWYTNDLSECKAQPLYTAVLSNDEMTVEKRIGIRDIQLNTEKDEWGNNFQIVLNGKRVFAKGGNLIPFAAIPEDADNSDIDYYLDLSLKCNFNVIRVWGGGEYASEYLLDKCDEMGILVWQDFGFACNMYPFYEQDFLNNVLKEAEENVKRIALHSCLALWCGNNELEVMFSYLPKNTKLMKSYVEFFYHTLPDYIKPFTNVPYIATSPIGTEPFKNYSSDGIGDNHMWNVWHGLKPLNYYSTRYARFLSEFGLESLPSMKAINTFAAVKDYSLSSDAFMSHQKCVGGNAKMMFYLKEKFDEPAEFEDLPYLTGIVQAECVKSATEHFRRCKGRCNGSVFWQLNDVWNCPSWSAVDFEKVPKALMYMAKSFFAPVALSYDKPYLYLHNDTLSDKEITLHITILNVDRIKKEYDVNTFIKSDSVLRVCDIPLDKGDVLFVKCGDVTLCYDNKATLFKSDISVNVDGNKITVKPNTFTKNICIECDGTADDNYFSLMPGEKKTVTFDKNITDYTIRCENNIKFRPGKIKKKLGRFFYRLQPLNIGNAFFYEFN